MSDSRIAWLLSNPWTKLGSILLALITWLYVQGDEVHEGTVKATVVWSLPVGLVSAEPLPTSVTLNVRGTRAATRRAKESIVKLPVDLSDIGVGEHGLEFASFVARGLPPSIEVLGVQPSSLRFTLDEQAERKVKIRAVHVGDPAVGFEVQDVVIDPPVVDVVGPRGAVEALIEVESQPIDVSGLMADTETEVGLELPRSVQLAGDVSPVATIRVVPMLERRVFTGVKVQVWGRYDFAPETPEVEVTLEGPSAELRGMRQDRVVAIVHLPDEIDRARYEAWFGPQDGVRVRVLHPGAAEVQVIGVTPPNLFVVRR